MEEDGKYETGRKIWRRAKNMEQAEKFESDWEIWRGMENIERELQI